ncbi:hypothetical protein LCGC14_0220380 [marine sediment metagenome]|uniref:Uncharacterized protein n=1 Tax=marine sediment metagenome TaxID=412755 RepID=A0A0F9UUJ5_9ZZZZ
MLTPSIGTFVKIIDGRIGVIVGNEHSGGVFRGHCNVWFGMWSAITGDRRTCQSLYCRGDTPRTEHLLVTDDWTVVETPVGCIIL